MRSRLERRHDSNSLKQAGKYLLFTFIGLFLLIKFGLPALIKVTAFVSSVTNKNQPVETQTGPAPAAPTLAALPEATNSGKIVVSGYSEPDTSVKLNRGGIDIEDVTADNDGHFEFNDVVLKEGDNDFYAKAVDDQGNQSEPSKTYTVILDTEAPHLTIDSPKDGQKFFDKDSPITLSGQTDPGSQLTVNAKFIFVGSDGKFSSKWPLSSGDNQLEFISLDAAGNQTKTTLTVNYTP